MTDERHIRQQLEAARTAHENLLAREQQQARDLAERRKVEQAAREQARLDAEKAAALSAATVDATARLQRTEQQAADLDSRIADLHTEQAALRPQLAREVARLSPCCRWPNACRFTRRIRCWPFPCPPTAR